MPAKIVYGKRRNADRNAYARFLSPEKDVVAKPEDSPKAASCATGVRWQQVQAASAVHKKPLKETNDVSVLEKGLESLRIEQTQTADEVLPTKKSKARRAKARDVSNTPKESAVSGEESLQQGMGALDIGSVTHDDPKTKRPGRTRKALTDCDLNALSGVDSQTQDSQEEKKQKMRLQPISVPTESKSPARRRNAVDVGRPTSTSPQRQSHLPTPEPTPEPESLYTAYASPLLALSDRKNILAFQDWSEELEPHFEISKIAEASFSEVYRLSATSSTSGMKEESVLKVVALKTPPTAPLPSQLHSRSIRDREGQIEKESAQREEDDQWKSHVDDVLSEVKLLQNLTHIPGFTFFRDLTVVQGRPSAAFNDAWKDWNKGRPRGKKSEFPDPSKRTSYDESQLWAIVEMQDAGTDLEKIMENGGLGSIWEIWDVFWGVAISVGKAEEACRFEHRDLHLGNICVRSSRSGANLIQPDIKHPLRRKLRFTGLETTVIDYTLSRADIVTSPSRHSSTVSEISNSTASSIDDEGETSDVAYLDLNKDPALFQGDATEEYQYEIYRYMRGAALYNNPLQSAPYPSPSSLEEKKEEEPEIPSTPRRSPRKNTHIRFDAEDCEHQPRRSPRKHAESAEPAPVIPKAQPTDEENIWRSFHPKTNLVWLHFLLHKLLAHIDSLGASPSKLSIKQITKNVQLAERRR